MFATLITILITPNFQSMAHASARANAQVTNCQLSDSEKANYLNMDFWKFDQTQEGWRGIEAKGCEVETRDLIDQYALQNKAKLKYRDYQLLLWHGGQLTAFLNDYPGAIQRMKQTYHDDESSNAAFLWNPYVAATLAFLNSDSKELKAARDKLSQGTDPNNHRNLRVVDSLSRCFSSTYREAYSRTCTPKETNQNRIQSMAVPIDQSQVLPLGIQEYLKSLKVILVGEMHGTVEMPEIFSQMVQAVASQDRKTLVALEIPQTSQTSIDLFIKTGDLAVLKKDPFFTSQTQDGRSSQAMVQLLKNLSHLPSVEVFCMDTGELMQQERDTGMAQAITLKAIGYDHVLIFAGNVHGSAVVGTDWDLELRPMGLELLRMNPQWDTTKDVMNILIRYSGGSSWNCMSGATTCGIQTWPQIKTDYSEALPLNGYFLLEDGLTDGYGSSFFIREIHASEPL